MPLTSLHTLLCQAQEGAYALGYFECWDIYSLEAVVEAAEGLRSPVIIGCGGMMVEREWLDRAGIETLGAVGRALAERASVPVALMLNEVHTLEEIRRGLEAGYNAVMLDVSDQPLDQAVDVTARVVELAKPFGAVVEGELGHLPDASTGSAESAIGGELTDPDAAASFVTATGVHVLAVSIGNAHLVTAGTTPIRLDRLAAIHAAVPVPLAIHGGSGFPNATVPAAIRLGVAKFNVGTVLKQVFYEAAREQLRGHIKSSDYQQVVGSRKAGDFLLPGKIVVRQVVASKLQLYGSAGRV